jgi:hypothetical protein
MGTDQTYRELLQLASRQKKYAGIRIGIPAVAGLGLLIYGFIYGELALMIMSLLLIYIGWQKYEQYRTAQQIFGAIEHLAEAIDQQTPELPQD